MCLCCRMNQADADEHTYDYCWHRKVQVRLLLYISYQKGFLFQTCLIGGSTLLWCLLNLFLGYWFLGLLNGLLSASIMVLRWLYLKERVGLILAYVVKSLALTNHRNHTMLVNTFLVVYYIVLHTGGSASPLRTALVVLPLFPPSHHFLWATLIILTYVLLRSCLT